MDDDFHNRHDWLAPTLALALWFAHFSVLWAASIIFPGAPAARWIALVATIGALVALGALWQWRRVRSIYSVAGLGIALGVGGVVFDAMPALIG